MEHADATVASGTVRGSGSWRYSVSVGIPPDDDEQDSLDVSCTCPHFERDYLCKHLFAFLLELDEIEGGPELPGKGSIDLFPSDSDDDDIVIGFDEEDLGLGQEGHDTLPTKRRPDPTWWRLAIAGTHEPATHREREVFYVISPERSEAGGLLHVQLMERARTGQEGRLKTLSVRPEEIAGRFAPNDERALQALVGCMSGGPSYLGTSYVMAPPAFHTSPIASGLQPLVVPVLAHTGRLGTLAPGEQPAIEHLTFLRWDGEREYGVAPRLVRSQKVEAEDSWQLVAELSGPEAPRIEDLDAVLSNGLFVAGDRIVRIDAPHLTSFVEGFRQHGPIQVDAERVPEVLERSVELPVPRIEIPDELGWTEETGVPTGRLEILAPDAHTPRTLLDANVFFEYEGARFSTGDTKRGFADREQCRLVRRDFDRERALVRQLKDQGFRDPPAHMDGIAGAQLLRSRTNEHVAALLALGWQVDAQGVRVRSASAQHLSVSAGIDWFDLEGNVSFDDQVVTLPELLAATSRGDTTVALGDGTHGLLPEEWLAQVAPLAELGQREGDAIRFLPSQALLLDALLAAQPAVDVDKVFRQTCRKLERARLPKRVRAPRGLRGTLRPYQKEGLGWLKHMGELGLGACLADDMGLGKTLQALALVAARRQARAEGEEALPSLAVVPASLVHNWLDEAARFTPGLSALAYHGPGRAALLDRLPETDLVVTTYATLRRDAAKLADQRFDCAILDEAQAIKNASALVSKAARLVRAEQRVALSGTPVENHLGELWALFDFLNPGMLGASARRAKTLADAEEDTVTALGKALGPFILRRTKGEVLKELPEKTEQTLTCELEGKQKRLYHELRDHYRQSLLARVDERGMARSKIHVLEALLRLRQAACHPGLVDPKRAGDGSAKLDVLHEHLAQTLDEGHKALVFSQFTSLLALVRTQLDAAGTSYAYLDGRTRKRGERVKRFQEDPDCRVFLVSLKAGGQGLNLTAADYVFLLDPWWNPAVETQAIDRAHRIGQTRPVFAYRIVAKDTIEEKILELQEHKRKLADAIVSGAAGGVRNLTREDLEVLLG